MSVLIIFKHQDQCSPSINRITRRNSFSQSNRDVKIENIGEINNSPVSLKRSNAISDLYLFDEHGFLSYSTTIEYTDTEINDINSEHYVYCDIASTLQINNLGMSVNNDGNLVLIKGKRYDLFKGLKKSIRQGTNIRQQI